MGHKWCDWTMWRASFHLELNPFDLLHLFLMPISWLKVSEWHLQAKETLGLNWNHINADRLTGHCEDQSMTGVWIKCYKYEETVFELWFWISLRHASWCLTQVIPASLLFLRRIKQVVLTRLRQYCKWYRTSSAQWSPAMLCSIVHGNDRGTVI